MDLAIPIRSKKVNFKKHLIQFTHLFFQLLRLLNIPTLYKIMKKSFLILIILPFINACGSKKQNDDATLLRNKQTVIDSMNQVARIKEQQREIDSLKMVTTNNVARKEESNSANGYTSSNSIPTTPVSYASTKRKKKMGKVAKGAIIGAGTGAVVGAIVSKKKGKGAIIGGVLGAGAGAGVGAVIEKKQKSKERVVYFK